MEPFVIQCTTCRARLKVSDPALVGDIVECPKCSSFVQVAPPAGWQPPAAGAVAPASGVGLASVSTSGTIPIQRASQHSNADPKQQPTARKAAAAALVAPPPLPGGNAIAPASASGAASRNATSSTSNLIVPELATEPGAMVRLLAMARKHSWISAGSLASLAAGVLIAWLVSGSKTETPLTTDLQTAEVAIGNEPEPGTTDHAADGSDGHPPAEDAASADDPDSSPTTQALVDSPNPNDATSESVDAAPAAQVDAEPQPSADAQAAGSSATSRVSAFPSDPLDPIARALVREPEPLPSTNPGAAPSDLPPRDRASGESTVPSAVVSEATTSSTGSPGDADSTSAELDSVKRARLAAHLQDKIAAVEFKDVPLSQFVAFLSDLSTIPITIDSESLLQAGKGAKTKITVKLAGVTVEAALRAALAKSGLTFHVEPKQIVIRAANSKR